jgi:Tol biopolymer transport system component
MRGCSRSRPHHAVRGRLSRAGLTLAALALALPAQAAAQAVPPDAIWRTFDTPHFRVTYPAELESLARHAAERAEYAWERLAAELTRPPRGPVELVISDNVDYSNAFATPFYNNRITVYAKPPVDHAALAFHTDWLDMVIIHELVHIFHLDRSGPFGRLVRSLFGRVPAPWPIFPVVMTPTWHTEGLATYFESRFTGAGRVHGSFHDMVLRTAALEDRFDTLDRVTGGYTPIWPGGMRPYIYGSMFVDWLAQQHGDTVAGRMVERTARSLVPTFLWFDWVGYRTMGRTFAREYRAFRADVAQRTFALADSLRALGLTTAERVTDRGQLTLYPRLSPDGAVLAYVSSDGREPVGTYLLDHATGATRRSERRNLDGLELTAASWLPDGSGLVYSQWQFRGPYRLYEDLYVMADGHERRLTRDARLTEPDVARDGRIVAVQLGGGSNRLVLVDGATGALTPITDAQHDRYWSAPRWSPDGRRIAVSRWQAPGEYDVVVLDAAGNLLFEATRDHAIDATPAWTPDGRWVLFFSDRSGIANLYAFDVAAAAAGVTGDAALRQVTNVLTGAFHPEVSPDGRWIYFAEYHARGFDIARIPFDPAGWRAPAPVRPHPEAYGEQPPGHTHLDRTAGAPRASAGGPERAYSALPSARPYFWLPIFFNEPVLGDAFGVTSAGQDVIGRHAWAASVALFPQPERRTDAWFSYANRALGNPIITVRAGRAWTGAVLSGRLPGEEEPVPVDRVRREDEVAVGLAFLQRRWRSGSRLGLSAERVWRRDQLADERFVLADPDNDLFGASATLAFWNRWAQPQSISPEDGVYLQVGGRYRRDLTPHQLEAVPFDWSYSEISTWNAGYLSLPLPGFSRHVLALRGSGLFRVGERAPLSNLGGAYGTALDAGLLGDLGGGVSAFLPVRGFAPGERFGSRAWSASMEYRLPLFLVGRGVGGGTLPIFLDRVSATLFGDAGDAWCPQDHMDARFCSTPDLTPLLSAGLELSLDLGLFYSPPLRARFGWALPLRPRDDVVHYVAFGLAF